MKKLKIKITFKLPKDNILNEPKNNVDKPKNELDMRRFFRKYC